MTGLNAYDYSIANGTLPIINSIREGSPNPEEVEDLLKSREHNPFRIILMCNQNGEGERLNPTKSYQEKVKVAERLRLIAGFLWDKNLVYKLFRDDLRFIVSYS